MLDYIEQSDIETSSEMYSEIEEENSEKSDEI